MRPFLAIVGLTVRNAMRSHLFQMLLGLLAVCVGCIPFTVSGDGTAMGFIQISLLYSLSAVILVLSLSSIWLSCYIMTHDIDSYQLHMVISKPISRVTIWLGKFSGIIFINTILLAISATAIYLMITWNFSQQSFTPEEKSRIENEVMVGRRVFFPDTPDIDEIARKVMAGKIKRALEAGKSVDDSPVAQEKLLQETKREVQAQMSAIPAGGSRQWVFSNLPVGLDRPLYMRYRTYIGKIATEGQRLTNGMWFLGKAVEPQDKDGKKIQTNADEPYQLYMIPLSQQAEQLKSGDFHEKVFPAEWNVVAPDGKLFLGYTNADAQQAAQYFQTSDGPKILLRECGFVGNYARAIFVIFLLLIVLTGIGCMAAGIFTMPTAIFVVISYLVFGALGTFWAENTYFAGTADYVSFTVSKIMLLVIIPIQKFEVTDLLAHGELIELTFIGGLILKYVICRTLPFILLGIWIYRRREMGLVIRK